MAGEKAPERLSKLRWSPEAPGAVKVDCGQVPWLPYPVKLDKMAMAWWEAHVSRGSEMVEGSFWAAKCGSFWAAKA